MFLHYLIELFRLTVTGNLGYNSLIINIFTMIFAVGLVVHLWDRHDTIFNQEDRFVFCGKEV